MEFGDRDINIKVNMITRHDTVSELTYSISTGLRNTINLVKMPFTKSSFDKIILANIIDDISGLSLVNDVINLSYTIVETLPKSTTNPRDVLELIYNIIRDRYRLPIPMAATSRSKYEDGEISKLVKDVNRIIDEIMSNEDI